jgi:hypothetical protein
MAKASSTVPSSDDEESPPPKKSGIRNNDEEESTRATAITTGCSFNCSQVGGVRGGCGVTVVVGRRRVLAGYSVGCSAST